MHCLHDPETSHDPSELWKFDKLILLCDSFLTTKLVRSPSSSLSVSQSVSMCPMTLLHYYVLNPVRVMAIKFPLTYWNKDCSHKKVLHSYAPLIFCPHKKVLQRITILTTTTYNNNIAFFPKQVGVGITILTALDFLGNQNPNQQCIDLA